MSEKTIVVHLPETAYRKLQRAAALTYRSIDDVLISTIEASLPTPDDLPAVFAEELAALHILSDIALWAAVEPSMSASEQTRLTQLNELAKERFLMASETAEQQDLLNAYYRSILRRAQALAILAQRGHPITLDTLAHQ